MTRKQYLYEIERLGLSQEEAGRALGMSKRTGQRWAENKGPPPPVAAVLILVDGDKHKLEVVMRQAKR